MAFNSKRSLIRNILLISSLSVLFLVLVLIYSSYSFYEPVEYSSVQQFSKMESFNFENESLDNEISLESSFPNDIDLSNEVEDVFESSVHSDDVFNDDTQSGINHGWYINKLGYTYVYNDCGYEQFNFKPTALDRYVNSINKLSDVLPENITIFNIVVPVSSTFASIPREIYIEDGFYNQSQSAFVSTIATKTNDRIINIPIIEVLEQAYDNDEYVFFRTDRNWTSNGAYYAYNEFCKIADFSAFPLESFRFTENGEFLGSFYNATLSTEMADNPDTFLCVDTGEFVKTSLTVYDKGIVYTNFNLCNNNSTVYNKYNFFLGKDAERYEIHTNTNGGSLLIIGDTSAHAIIPYLALNYERIDYINPLNFSENLSNFLQEREYDHCITMCYSTNAISGDYVPEYNILTGATQND